METLVKDPLHQVSLGQALAHSMQPRSTIPPILFGLSVELDHVFGSKWVLNDLDWLGLSMSYSEITRFKYSVLVNYGLKKFLEEVATDAFSLWPADNADHDICSLNGLGLIAWNGNGNIYNWCYSSQSKSCKTRENTEIIRDSQKQTCEDHTVHQFRGNCVVPNVLQDADPTKSVSLPF